MSNALKKCVEHGKNLGKKCLQVNHSFWKKKHMNLVLVVVMFAVATGMHDHGFSIGLFISRILDFVAEQYSERGVLDV